MCPTWSTADHRVSLPPKIVGEILMATPRTASVPLQFRIYIYKRAGHNVPGHRPGSGPLRRPRQRLAARSTAVVNDRA